MPPRSPSALIGLRDRATCQGAFTAATEGHMIFLPKQRAMELSKEKIITKKEKKKKEAVFTAFPTDTAACIKYLCYFCSYCHMHAWQGRLYLTCPFPSGASVHCFSPTSTFALPISRSETNGEAILLPFLSFFISSNFTQGGCLPPPRPGAAL